MTLSCLKAVFLFSFIFSPYSILSQDLLPIKGKWNTVDTKDYIGIWKKSHKKGYLDGNGNGTISGVTALLGNSGDSPLTLNYLGDEREEFALYRPDTRELIFFSDYSDHSSITLIRQVGNPDDIPITGDWDGDGKDGFALYRPSTREFWFYQNYDSPQPFSMVETGNSGDLPLAGNWDGINGDGFALYRPSTREIWFYQNYNESQPSIRFEVGNHGDTVIAGDWDGDGTDGVALFRQTTTNDYEFWLYAHLNSNPTQSIFWYDQSTYVTDISEGRKIFYTQKVPHVDFNGNYRTTYDPALSFIPKGIYNAIPSDLNIIHQAGYNLSFLWSTYNLDQSTKDILDLTGNSHRTILYLKTPGGIPFVGKFTGSKDLPGISSNDNSRIIYYDSNGDEAPDNHFVIGDPADIAFTGDWNGDNIDEFALYKPDLRQLAYFNSISNPIHFYSVTVGNWDDKVISGNWDGAGGDGYALYRPSTREIWYYQNYNDTEPFAVITVGNSGDQIIAGDWNGDGRDGFAVYRPSTREFWFYQEYNSTIPFVMQTFGNPGDVPTSGDWDGDGVDGYGIYRTDNVHSKHELWLLNSVYSSSSGMKSISFGNPIIENIPKKYVFGLYTADEPGGNDAVWQQNYDYLSQIYPAYSNLSSQIFFHVDIPYVSPENNSNYNYWWKKFAVMGEATAHDDYPIQKNANDVTTIASIGETIERSRTETNENLPNWFVPQAFQDTSGTSFKFYKPSAGQYKAMVYTSLVHGATGILSFTYHNSLFPGIHGISPTNYPDLWTEAKNVNSELDILKPIILSPTSEANYKIYTDISPIYENAPIRSVLKLVDDYYVLLTVNLTQQPLNAIIQLPISIAPEDGNIEKLFENSSIKTSAGAINVSFSSFGVHVFKFKAPNSSLTNGREKTVTQAPKLIESIEAESDFLKVYPIPSKSSVTFEISKVAHTNISLIIYDSQGKIVKEFYGKNCDNSVQVFTWNGISDNERIASGLYFYKVFGELKCLKSGKIVLVD